MYKKPYNPIMLAGVILILVSLACSSSATPTVVPTDTIIPPTATATLKPTSTPRPTATPNIAKTKEAEADQATLQKYVDSGYIASTEGTLYTLQSTSFEMAQKNYLNIEDSGYHDPVLDFAFWGDLKWSSAGQVNYPEYSGCGIAFRVGDNFVDQYTAMITNESVLVTWCFAALGNRCGRVGVTRGKGRVKFGNPAEAHFEFIENSGHAYALVNGEFIGEYTLFQDRLTEPGYFTYSIISGTNKDYGTRCSVDNAKLWVPK